MATEVTLTPAAAKFMTRMVRFSEHADAGGFRLLVSAGGCSGYSSEFSVQAAPNPGDETVVVSGVKMFLPAESRLMLQGVTIDFADTPTKSGLTFFNPNAAPCACSSSGESLGAPQGVVTVGLDALKRH